VSQQSSVWYITGRQRNFRAKYLQNGEENWTKK